MAQILVVEDDAAQCETMCAYICASGHLAIPAGDAAAAEAALAGGGVQLVICDVMLPGEDGFSLCRRMRRTRPRLPILMVTARGEMEDKRQGFSSGADDYMTKPVELDEMMMRIGALLRRADIHSENRICVGDTVIDAASRTVLVRGVQVREMPRREFDLLFHLLSYPGQVMTRRQLMQAVWGVQCESDERTVDVHIARLREHLCGVEDFEIATVRGIGYRARVKKDAQ